MPELQSGRYKITNAKSNDRVLDLSGADNHSIIGYQPHGGDNQKWDLERTSDGWHLKSASSGLYASIDSLENGTKVVGRPDPYLWHIWEDSGAYRVSVPNAKKSLDLSNHGAGPDVEIWGKWEGKNQLWYFERA